MAWFGAKYESSDKSLLNSETAYKNGSPGEVFKQRRQIEQWKYGSGLDYDH